MSRRACSPAIGSSSIPPCDLGRQRRFTDAIKVLAYGLELHPDSETLVYYMAQMLEHAGRTEEAIAAYNRVFAMEPSTGIAGMTKMLLTTWSRETRRQNGELPWVPRMGATDNNPTT